MKAVVAAFNQEKALVGAFSVITNLGMDLFEALLETVTPRAGDHPRHPAQPHLHLQTARPIHQLRLMVVRQGQ